MNSPLEGILFSLVLSKPTFTRVAESDQFFGRRGSTTLNASHPCAGGALPLGPACVVSQSILLARPFLV